MGVWIILRSLRLGWTCVLKALFVHMWVGCIDRWELSTPLAVAPLSFFPLLSLFFSDSLPWWPQPWLLQSAQSPVVVCSNKPKEKQINGEEELLVLMSIAYTHMITCAHTHTCPGKRETSVWQQKGSLSVWKGAVAVTVQAALEFCSPGLISRLCRVRNSPALNLLQNIYS